MGAAGLGTAGAWNPAAAAATPEAASKCDRPAGQCGKPAEKPRHQHRPRQPGLRQDRQRFSQPAVSGREPHRLLLAQPRPDLRPQAVSGVQYRGQDFRDARHRPGLRHQYDSDQCAGLVARAQIQPAAPAEDADDGRALGVEKDKTKMRERGPPHDRPGRHAVVLPRLLLRRANDEQPGRSDRPGRRVDQGRGRAGGHRQPFAANDDGRRKAGVQSRLLRQNLPSRPLLVGHAEAEPRRLVLVRGRRLFRRRPQQVQRQHVVPRR